MSEYKIPMPPELSDWQCQMFGSRNGNGIVYRPVKGDEPNAFQRWMSNVFFACKWEKVEK